MTHRTWAARMRRLTGTAVIAAVLSGIASPAFAGTPPSKTTRSSPFSAEAIAKAVAPEAATSATATPAPTPAAPKAPQSSDSFLKSKKGMVVIALLAVGTGYAIYSAKEDRIKGLNR